MTGCGPLSLSPAATATEGSDSLCASMLGKLDPLGDPQNCRLSPMHTGPIAVMNQKTSSSGESASASPGARTLDLRSAVSLLPSQRHLFDIPDDVVYMNCAYM